MVVLVLAAFGFAAVAKLTQLAMTRLGLDGAEVLLFFGIAESPHEPAPRRLRPVPDPPRGSLAHSRR